MTQDRMIADILIALVRAHGGKLSLSLQDLANDPDEAVYINATPAGYDLILKNGRIID